MKVLLFMENGKNENYDSKYPFIVVNGAKLFNDSKHVKKKKN